MLRVLGTSTPGAAVTITLHELGAGVARASTCSATRAHIGVLAQMVPDVCRGGEVGEVRRTLTIESESALTARDTENGACPVSVLVPMQAP